MEMNLSNKTVETKSKSLCHGFHLLLNHSVELFPLIACEKTILDHPYVQRQHQTLVGIQHNH